MKYPISLIITVLTFFALYANAQNNDLQLWYNKPAQKWTEALPIGNGNLGAMIYGGTDTDRIQFNEATLWNLGPHDYNKKDAYQYLPVIRQLLAEGKQKEAEALAEQHFMGVQYGDAGYVCPHDDFCYQADYQPFGELQLTMPGGGDDEQYRRSLDISNAISTTTFKRDGITYTKEYFANAPDNLIAIHTTASKAGMLNIFGSFKSAQQKYTLRKVDNHTIALDVVVNNSVMKGSAYLYVNYKGGKLFVTDNEIQLKNSNEATFYLIAYTNYKNYKDVSANPDAICRTQLPLLQQLDYEKVKARHITEYKKYFNTFSIHLNNGISKAALPTDQRIKEYSITQDPALVSLYVQYGRYLLLSSSRPGTHAANLQGIWNDLLTPPWGSKYTTNINLEMNYWPAELLNLSACAQPLFQQIKEIAQSGTQTAKDYYNAPGWVFHHNTDQWRGTAPINASDHGIWVTGGAWLCNHVWEHYQFTNDKKFLQTEAYPLMKSSAEFFTHFLVKDSITGWLISTPSNSPEQGGLVAGPTMDHQIIRELFKNTIAAATVLNVDGAFRKILQAKYDSIAPNKIGKHNQLQEWLQDIDDTTNKHRHVSHLWGVYPGADITWNDSKMMNAAKQSLLYRGDGGTGWSMAWKVNLWARFKDGDHAMMMFNKLLTDVTKKGSYGGVYPNLFDAHPPFQIDGNFGGAAGIAEMLLQSHMGYIELLPALPSSLPDGEVKGLCARGGFTLNIQWAQGKLKHVEILSNSGNECTLEYVGKTIQFKTQKGKTYSFDNNLK